MRRTLILTLAVLFCAAAACTASLVILNGTVDGARELGSLAVLAANEGRRDEARERMVHLADYWRDREGLLELMASHDALHEVGAAVAQAVICLECEDHDDFLRTMCDVDMALGHLRDEEALSWENLY